MMLRCHSCRKKKAKCSRRSPCSQCVRFNIECVYDDRRGKPGLRTGAVENLNQRVVALENMFLGQGILWQQVWRCLNAIQGPVQTSNVAEAHQVIGDNDLVESISRLKSTLSSLPLDLDLEAPDTESNRPIKRRRRNSNTEEEFLQDIPPIRSEMENDLPPDDLIDSLVEIYFANIHPWIPILHVRQFREKKANPALRPKLTTIFHAIVSLCVRFSYDPRLENSEVRTRFSKKSREKVILQSMESFSVENLQALIICAFDTIGSGRGPSAWSMVGSMTRTVEQLQLSIEDEDQRQPAEILIKRMAFLPPAKSWTEREERRRVFWNIFLMDRFCSIATGWNFSLTSADVKRRLPCEGALWEEGKPLEVPTPYFGVGDKSTEGVLPTNRPESQDQASIGGFAYCIEASESLSLVTTFFLRHAVNVSNMQDVQMWLMRFKELDLRLVQWKIFLPEKWREACALNADGRLDPNLTLAHITHNTAVGLLHQGIAYPSAEWQASRIRLPSLSSAETCLAAATEVAVIAEKYLEGSTSLTNPQFAFCLFISGRMLLAHASHYNVALPQEFDSLIRSLEEISRRWNGPHVQDNSESRTENLASKFAGRLVQAREQGPHSLDIREAAYSDEQASASRHDGLNPAQGRTPQFHTQHFGSSPVNNLRSSPELRNNKAPEAFPQNPGQAGSDQFVVAEQEGSPDSITLAFPPLPLAFQPHCASATHTTMPSPSVMNMQQQNLYYGQPAETGFPASNFPDNYGVSGGGLDDLNQLNSFFEYSFLPTQRISMFSGQQDREV
ncbi:fungal-specific transcription factor domain-containing protein [Bisporella sp. PMI_857]|nr:fungal-specific transcription factor domain-containing protein [Bisporella sp. PMI_857]